MIKEIRIEGLNNSNSVISHCFNDDINILTGYNGCGKTTVLKVIWYITCGRLQNLQEEIVFERLILKTDTYEIGIEKDLEQKICAIDFAINTEHKHKSFPNRNITPSILNIVGLRLAQNSNESLFFPTFRRIEGGFSIDSMDQRPISNLNYAFNILSNSLSSDRHRFISSVSTEDISRLLSNEYVRITRFINELQKKCFSNIHFLIKSKKNNQDCLDEIEKIIDNTDQNSDEMMHPFMVLEATFKDIFRVKGISLDNLVLGEEMNAISSDKLSAGEKQLLSFLCYNIFSNNKIIIIDEPELSLHPDWQRKLLPLLLKQGRSNQFIIATHSPMIYSAYPEKEFILSQNKGE